MAGWLKLLSAQTALGLVCLVATAMHVDEAGLAAAGWQLGAIVVFFVLTFRIHDWFDVPQENLLHFTWGGCFVVWFFLIAGVTFFAQGPDVARDFELVGEGISERISEALR